MKYYAQILVELPGANSTEEALYKVNELIRELQKSEVVDCPELNCVTKQNRFETEEIYNRETGWKTKK
jgi:hypothetical protein